jgi:anti-anti-sigma regulatory factor
MLRAACDSRPGSFKPELQRTNEKNQMGISLDQLDDSSLIRLDGVIDIASAVELKAALLAAFATGKEVRISLEATTDLDVTAFQLLWAAEREAKRLGVGLALTGQPPEKVVRSLARAGLDGLGIFA